MNDKYVQLTPELSDYMVLSCSQEHPILKELRDLTASLSGAQMQISPLQGHFMAMLVRLLSANNILELGTYTGYSSLCMALNQSPEGRVITCDIDDKTTIIAKKYWHKAGVSDRITLKLAPALETIAQLDKNQFDLIFIDADKRNLPQYYQRCYDLLKPNGLILIDNVLWGGKVIDMDNQSAQVHAIRELNQALKNDSSIQCCMLPIADGLTMVRKPST